MKHARTILAGLLLTGCTSLFAQQESAAPPAGQPSTPEAILAGVRAARGASENRQGLIAARLQPAAFLLVPKLAQLRSALTATERQRIDKQTGASPNAAGSTSLVERGTVPALLGLAVESGSVARTVNGTSLTFRARPAGLVRFLQLQDYFASAITSASPFWAQATDRISASVTFDASRGNEVETVFTGTRNQISGYGVRIDLWNTRDPRDRKYWRDWKALTVTVGSEAANQLTTFSSAVQADPAFKQWREETAAALIEASDEKLEEVLNKKLDAFLATQLANPSSGLKEAATAAAESWNRFAGARVNLIERALRAPTLSIEYAVTRQAPAVTAEANSGTGVTPGTSPTGSATVLPDLGTLRLVNAWSLGGNAEATINASLTNFDNTFKASRIRDYRVGVELAAPLMNISGWGKSSLSFSGLYLHLRNQPLGEPVKVNGHVIDSTGNVWFGQAKFELPVGGSGLRIPIALTYASRHELLKNERNKLGANIGLTFDLDKLVAAK